MGGSLDIPQYVSVAVAEDGRLVPAVGKRQNLTYIDVGKIGIFG